MYQMIAPIANFIALDRHSTTPIYLQIANALIHAIRNGQLRRGAKLSGVRTMATDLGIHRKTMQTALDELDAQGWIEILPRKGCFIVQELPEFHPTPLMQTRPIKPILCAETTGFPLENNPFSSFPMSDFQQGKHFILMEGLPDIRLSPLDELMREVRSMEKKGAFRKYFQYGNPQGTPVLRETLATYLSETRGLNVSAENMLITRGAQMGLYIAAQILIQKGDGVVVGNPSYVTATLTFERAGATIHRVSVDEYGLCVDEIEAICRKKPPRLVYAIPHHHHPTTVTLSPERRIKLLNLAAEYQFAIVEDDYDYDFHYASSPLLPMASFDQNGNVIYVGTLSKTLAPAVRIGFIVAPKNFIQEATLLRRSIDFQGDSLLEMAVAELYKNGVIPNYIKKVVKIYKQRRDSFCHLLTDIFGNDVSFKKPDGGLSVWAKFPHADLPKMAKLAAEQGVVISDGQMYNTNLSQNFTRLGFAAFDVTEQEMALRVLSACWQRKDFG